MYAEMTTVPSELCDGWLGFYQLLGSNGVNLGSLQAIDLTPANLSTSMNEPGYVQQSLTLEKEGYYNVSYRWALKGI